MPELGVIQLAQAGDASAIALLMNSSLQAIGIQARVALRDDTLYVLLESERALATSPCVEFIQQGLARLKAKRLAGAVVYSCLTGESDPIWVQQVPPLDAASFNPFLLAENAELDGTTAIIPLPSPQPRKVRLFDLLLLGVPLYMVFSTAQIWNRYLVHRADSSPTAISLPQFLQPTTGAARPRAQLVVQTNQVETERYQIALEQARQAVKLGETATSREEWRAAITQWQGAIDQLKQIPATDPVYAQAQYKQQVYRQNMDQLVRDKLSSMGMELKKTIEGGISPKSIAYSGKDLFFAQNMMYGHTITVYDRNYDLVKTISDSVRLADFGYSNFPGEQQGAPVEAAFSEGGKVAWVSNYQMHGAGFNQPTEDNCTPAQDLDPGFLYRINTETLAIDHVVQVGAVPKFIATSSQHPYALVSNWCSWDVSVVDTQTNQEVRRLQVGPYPRGIAISAQSDVAYVALMGAFDVAAIDLNNFTIRWIKNVGNSPRHLAVDQTGQYLYVSLNGEGSVAKVDLTTDTVVAKVKTGQAPRSLALSSDGEFLYVVNYDSDTVSKLRTTDMQVAQTVTVNPGPIGVTYDPKTHQVWVACYSGSILVFQD